MDIPHDQGYLKPRRVHVIWICRVYVTMSKLFNRDCQLFREGFVGGSDEVQQYVEKLRYYGSTVEVMWRWVSYFTVIVSCLWEEVTLKYSATDYLEKLKVV
jgi:hypothetical protein